MLYRPGKQVREMSDSYRCSSTDSENMLEKLHKFIHSWAKMFRDGGANAIMSSHVNISLFDANTSQGL
jgi:hypothetical protein